MIAHVATEAEQTNKKDKRKQGHMQSKNIQLYTCKAGPTITMKKYIYAYIKDYLKDMNAHGTLRAQERQSAGTFIKPKNDSVEFVDEI